jgi:hypothetical protein
MKITVFWVGMLYTLVDVTNVLEDHTTSIYPEEQK